MHRPGWDDYFLTIAAAVSSRADCTRAQHGAVVVKDHRIVATGYNGAPAGRPGCASDGMCPRGQSDVPSLSSYDSGPGMCIAVHAEANALLYSDRAGTEGSTVYITGPPCGGCEKLMMGAGVASAKWLMSGGKVSKRTYNGYFP